MPKVKLTPAVIKRLTCPPGKKREWFWDNGIGLMVTNTGHRSFKLQGRPRGSRRTLTDTLPGTLPLSDVRREARRLFGDLAKGVDPREEKRAKARAAEGTFMQIAESYFKRERHLRSIEARRRDFERLVYPTFAAVPIEAIRRSDINKLLDKIEDERGPVMATLVGRYLSRLFNWHAARSDSFNSPIVRGMARTSAKERARARVLTDDELARVWRAAGELNGPFGAFIKFLALTGARRCEAARMSRSELVGANWELPAARNKTKVDFVRPLSAAARAVLAELPQIGDCDFYFTMSGKGPINGFAKWKRRLDAAAGVHGWVLHDLRRGARSLMSRAGVPSDHAERCLGHVIPGIRATYDRHQYELEMKVAFERLATLIEGIVTPQQNVVPMRAPVS